MYIYIYVNTYICIYVYICVCIVSLYFYTDIISIYTYKICQKKTIKVLTVNHTTAKSGYAFAPGGAVKVLKVARRLCQEMLQNCNGFKFRVQSPSESN